MNPWMRMEIRWTRTNIHIVGLLSLLAGMNSESHFSLIIYLSTIVSKKYIKYKTQQNKLAHLFGSRTTPEVATLKPMHFTKDPLFLFLMNTYQRQRNLLQSLVLIAIQLITNTTNYK